MTEVQNGDESSGWWELRWGWGGRKEGVAIGGQLRDPCVDGTVCVWTVSVPTVWLWFLTSFQRCHIVGKLEKPTWALSVFLLTTGCESVIIIK